MDVKSNLLLKNIFIPERVPICIFIVEIYIQAWFSAPSAVEAPSTDFEFLKKLKRFEKIDAEISRSAIQKFKKHLWYLSPEDIGLAFAALQTACELDQNVKRATIGDRELPDVFNDGIEQFVSAETKCFFERFEFDTEFLKLCPSKWNADHSYENAVEVVKQLTVVNDSAERGVKLMEGYNKLLTKNEQQKQYVLQVVTNYRRRFPNCSKQTLSQAL